MLEGQNELYTTWPLHKDISQLLTDVLIQRSMWYLGVCNSHVSVFFSTIKSERWCCAGQLVRTPSSSSTAAWSMALSFKLWCSSYLSTVMKKTWLGSGKHYFGLNTLLHILKHLFGRIFFLVSIFPIHFLSRQAMTLHKCDWSVL